MPASDRWVWCWVSVLGGMAEVVYALTWCSRGGRGPRQVRPPAGGAGDP